MVSLSSSSLRFILCFLHCQKGCSLKLRRVLDLIGSLLILERRCHPCFAASSSLQAFGVSFLFAATWLNNLRFLTSRWSLSVLTLAWLVCTSLRPFYAIYMNLNLMMFKLQPSGTATTVNCNTPGTPSSEYSIRQHNQQARCEGFCLSSSSSCCSR